MELLDDDYLIAQVRVLKSDLALADRSSQVARLCRWLKLNRQQGKLMMALYDAKGKNVSVARLMDAIDTQSKNHRIVGVLVSQMRALVGKNAILSDWGLGYSISQAGREVVRKALEIEA